MRRAKTKDVEKLLKALGCVTAGTVGSHTKWVAPGGHSTIVVRDREQAAGTLRSIQQHLAPEFGAKWLEEGLNR